MTTQSIASGMPRAWVHVDLGALVRNGAALARHARVPLVPMVKADAYGLGVVEGVRALGPLDPLGFRGAGGGGRSAAPPGGRPGPPGGARPSPPPTPPPPPRGARPVGRHHGALCD